ncbi:MAG TPA: MBG domain-containing protein, partial [Verrucomicrobiae bacterium]|nr:MBG domain-containing protein [Verrucomicrobiae bacterium]
GGATYYFAATSFNLAGIESEFSTEVSYTIPSASCVILLTNLDQVYDGTPKSVSAATQPTDFGLVLTYGDASDPPVSAGSYWVSAISTDPGCPTSTMGLLTIEKAPALVHLWNLSQASDGTPKSVSFGTTPPGLNVAVTYNNSPQPPLEAGTYAVQATIQDPNYQGSGSATLTILSGTMSSRTSTAPAVSTGTSQLSPQPSTLVLHWAGFNGPAVLWQSPDMVHWTVLTNLESLSSFPVQQGPSAMFFKVVPTQAQGVAGVPISIGAPPGQPL